MSLPETTTAPSDENIDQVLNAPDETIDQILNEHNVENTSALQTLIQVVELETETVSRNDSPIEKLLNNLTSNQENVPDSNESDCGKDINT